MEESKKQSFFVRLFTINGKNLKLWLTLAAIPVGIVGFMYLFGASFFNEATYREDDTSLTRRSKEETISLRNEQLDINTHETGSLTLPETSPRGESRKMTTKDDKRMIGPNGALETMELEAGQTLRTLSTKRFGNSAFWVYFYEVNRDQVNDPDDLKEGMKLYIPNPEYYGFSSKDPNSIQVAKEKATQIFNSTNK